MEKRVELKLFAFILFFFLLSSTLLSLSLADERDDYYDMLTNRKKVGLTSEDADKLIKKYPTQADLAKEVTRLLKGKEDIASLEIEGIKIWGDKLEKLKDFFYYQGVLVELWEGIKNQLKSGDRKDGDSIIGRIAGFFGNILSWVIGLKKSNQARLWDFLVGFAAWLLIWLAFLLERGLFRFISDPQKRMQADEKIRWLDMLAGRWWKAIPFTLIYFSVMQIPVINQIIAVITFYHFTPPWYRPIIIAVIIGYLPAIGENLFRYLAYQKQQERKYQAKAAAQIVKEMGKYK